MAALLAQQRLLLELLVMSGEIAITTEPDESLLWRTLRECEDARWARITEISPGIRKAELTGGGKLALASKP
jgi:hypothetical protein